MADGQGDHLDKWLSPVKTAPSPALSLGAAAIGILEGPGQFLTIMSELPVGNVIKHFIFVTVGPD
jgi:hypothetical protein